MKQKILITSALPYANGALHFGHIAGAYLPADCYARFQRLAGKDTLFICGSDEYGVAIALSAKLAKRSPQDHVDIYHYLNRSIFEKLDIKFDHYSRTTWPGHVETTYQYFQDLYTNGYIREKVTDQLYSEEDNEFLADRYVVGACPKCGYDPARGDECPKCAASYEATELKNPRSKLSNAPLTLRPTKHWFLELDLFKENLVNWINQKNLKPNVSKFIKNYIDELHPRAITRDSSWGIPVPLPDAEGKVLYAWFDAPIGYISASREWAQLKGDANLWKNYWLDPQTKLVQFIGKDNIPFHSVIFPAMTMGQNQPYKTVDELPANEFYLLEGRQFSKSDGWYIEIEDFLCRYSTDQIRYMIAATAPENADSEFTWQEFQIKCNTELLGKYGNFAHRILVFIQTQFGGVVPPLRDLQEIDQQFLNSVHALVNQAASEFDHFHLRKATHSLMEIAQLGNVYFNQKQPWAKAKDPSQIEEYQKIKETTLACCLECLKCMALVSYPIIPQTAHKVWEFLGYERSIEDYQWQEVLSLKVLTGKKLTPPALLFQKVEDEQIEIELAKLKKFSEQKPATEKALEIEPLKPTITIDQFQSLDLRVGLVLNAEKVSKSKKLLKLEIDIGIEKRIILSGISEYYKPEDIIGKKVVVVANLKPAKLMGIESQGMILSAADQSNSELLSIENLPPGSIVR